MESTGQKETQLMTQDNILIITLDLKALTNLRDFMKVLCTIITQPSRRSSYSTISNRKFSILNRLLDCIPIKQLREKKYIYSPPLLIWYRFKLEFVSFFKSSFSTCSLGITSSAVPLEELPMIEEQKKSGWAWSCQELGSTLVASGQPENQRNCPHSQPITRKLLKLHPYPWGTMWHKSHVEHGT